MDRTIPAKALKKLAFFGYAGVPGSPAYTSPPMTVGQAMYNIGASNRLNPFERRSLLDKIVDSGRNVNSPVKSLVNAGIGALAGNFIANTLGAGPFWRGAMTAAGAQYGYGK